MKRVVFLDIDGVLNGTLYRDGLSKTIQVVAMPDIDPACVDLLNAITRRTGAQIVLTTWWRRHAPWMPLLQHLKQAGVEADIVGSTPAKKTRAEEIRAWLAANAVDSYVILEDDHPMPGFGPRAVFTSMSTGIVQKNAEQAVAVLLAPLRPDEIGARL